MPILTILRRREIGKRIDEDSMRLIVNDMERRARLSRVPPYPRLSRVPPYPREEELFKCWNVVIETLFNTDMAQYMAKYRPVSESVRMADQSLEV